MISKRPRGKAVIAAICILTTLLTPVASVSAQSLTNLTGNLGPIAGAAISCNKDNISGGLKSIFGSGKKKPQSVAEKNGGSVTGDSVPTDDEQIQLNTEDTAAQTEALKKKETCWDAIEKAAAQVMIKTITAKTVSWINNGFKDGDAIFIKDTGSYLASIQKQELTRFKTILGFDPNGGGFDEENFPFGKAVWVDAIRRTTQNYFQQNAAYSLNRVIGNQYPGMVAADFGADSFKDAFMRDFTIGGWAAFQSQFEPQNNPIGFELNAIDELAARIDGTGYSVAQDVKDQINRGMGFLDLKKCIDPEGEKDFTKCKKIETQTPGSVIAKQLDNVLGSPLRQLEYGEDLSSALTAVFDALLGQLITKGLSSLEVEDDNSTPASYENNGGYADNVAVDDTDGNFDGDWYTQGDQFDIFTDIPKLIDLETRYAGDNNSLLVRQVEVSQEIIPSIYQLDFCVPGPRPGWQEDAQNNLSAFFGSLPKNADDLLGNGAKIISKFFDPAGVIAPAIYSAIQGASDDSRNEHLYKSLIERSLGLEIERNNFVDSWDVVTSMFMTIFERYEEKIQQEYTRGFPSQRADNEIQFRKIGQYNKAIQENNEEIEETIGIIKQLQALQVRVNKLPEKDGYPGLNTDGSTPYANDLVNNRDTVLASLPNEYLRELRRISNTFNLIAQDVITEQDLTKEETALEALETLRGNMLDNVVQCIQETNSTTYEGRKDRMPYPEQFLTGASLDIRNLPKGISFLPGFYYGNGTAPEKEIKIDDILTVYTQCLGYYDPGTSSQYKSNFFGRPTPQTNASSKFYQQPDACLSAFENIIGNY